MGEKVSAIQSGTGEPYGHPGPPLGLSQVQIRVQKAVDLANNLHRWQYRSKIAVPYIVHPLDVLKIVTHEFGIDEKGHEDLWVAAVLHDTLEDTYIGDARTTVEDLQKLLGPGDYLRIVEELTFLGDDKKVYMESFRVEKSLAAFIIKVADRIANVRDYIFTSPGYAQKYYNKAQPLWEGLILRRDTIIANFGLDIYSKMESTLLGLTLALSSVIMGVERSGRREPGVPSREEMYQILKKRSDELQSSQAPTE